MRFCVWDEVHSIQVPEWVSDLESFRRWSDDEAYPGLDALRRVWP